MKRLIVLISLLLPLLVLGTRAEAASEFCTDNAPGGEIGVPVVDANGVYVAALVHPFTTGPVVGICYRVPTPGGGPFVGGIIYVESPTTTSSTTGGVTASTIARLECRSDANPTAVNCSEQLGGLGIVVSNPVMTSPTPPCLLLICLGGPTGIAGGTSTITVYLPLGGSVSVPITLPTQCVTNQTGPC